MKEKIKTESQEAIALSKWAKQNKEEHPELRLFFAIPNGGLRHITTASRMKLEGVRKGVLDYMLPVARHGKHGLFIELKKVKGGSTSPEQRKEILDLKKEGYAAVVAKGADEGIRYLKKYLNIK
jgi:hypothetical protein